MVTLSLPEPWVGVLILVQVAACSFLMLEPPGPMRIPKALPGQEIEEDEMLGSVMEEKPFSIKLLIAVLAFWVFSLEPETVTVVFSLSLGQNR